jgi:carboxyltransferase family protein
VTSVHCVGVQYVGVVREDVVCVSVPLCGPLPQPLCIHYPCYPTLLPRPVSFCHCIFIFIPQLAAYGMYGEDVPAAGVVTGIGRVHGTECVIVANDATVKVPVCKPRPPYAAMTIVLNCELCCAVIP